MPRFGVLDPQRRAEEKAEARKRDAAALRGGSVSPGELAVRNGFFSALDFRQSRIVAIGAKERQAFRDRKA